MDNKLSELSNPVAWASQRHIETRCNIEAFTDEESAKGTRWEKIAPLYSQEYVSSLLAEMEAKDNEIDAANARVDVMCAKAMNLTERAESAEKQLATPVRLPSKNDDEFWFDGVFQVAKFDRAVERAISAAGFKCVGGE